MGMENGMFWSESWGSGFGEQGGTPLLGISRSTPPPPRIADVSIIYPVNKSLFSAVSLMCSYGHLPIIFSVRGL